MIRLIVRIQDCGNAAHCDGAKADIYYKTFDIEHAELEKQLREHPSYGSANIIGAEVPHGE